MRLAFRPGPLTSFMCARDEVQWQERASFPAVVRGPDTYLRRIAPGYGRGRWVPLARILLRRRAAPVRT